jgi:hypothetical protein
VLLYCDEITVPSFHGLAVAFARVGGARHGDMQIYSDRVNNMIESN